MSLLINAIESIQVGVEDYLTDDNRRYLSAVRNICAGILLLYKEKLCQLSPSHDAEILIKKDIRPSYDDVGNVIFIGEGRKTVDVQEIKERFKSLKISVDWKKFDELNKLRNEIEHYYTDKTPDAVREIVTKSFLLIRDFIMEYLEEEPREMLGEDCWQALLETAEVYEAEEKVCRESLDEVNWKYQTIRNAVSKIRCPTCHSGLIKAEGTCSNLSYTPLSCSSCGNEFDFAEVVEQCLSDSLSAEIYTSVKETNESPLGRCPECYCCTYMFAENHCAACDYEQEYFECDMCGTFLSLDEQDLEGLCNYCQYKLDKLMAE
ncbi:hypothetical protein [Leptolyngbya sp. FACHB-17]|uniref:hypothetical protein n=1 Tax=unclassified Leptolyngbya TaxID=2650499 RepID=UPI0016803FBD|nr:hypothetical protein [Leptolyngbya sp. FACHB-17]MBD2078394.1 hypothetical protein [Leptolyngbya sp. FACHB-17]